MATKAAPKKLSSLNDLFGLASDLRAVIREKESELKALKEDQKEAEQRILDAMLDSGTEQHKVGGAGSYSIKRSTVPKVTDWAAVDKFVLKHKALDLFHRRITATAWQERADSGVIVPGIEPVTVTTLLWRGEK